MTRVTIDCVETLIDGHPVMLFNSPSTVEGREMICVYYFHSTILYLPPHGFNVFDTPVSSHYSSRFNSNST